MTGWFVLQTVYLHKSTTNVQIQLWFEMCMFAGRGPRRHWRSLERTGTAASAQSARQQPLVRVHKTPKDLETFAPKWPCEWIFIVSLCVCVCALDLPLCMPIYWCISQRKSCQFNLWSFVGTQCTWLRAKRFVAPSRLARYLRCGTANSLYVFVSKSDNTKNLPRLEFSLDSRGKSYFVLRLLLPRYLWYKEIARARPHDEQ